MDSINSKSRRNLARIANCAYEELIRSRRRSIPDHIPTQRFCELLMTAAEKIMLRIAGGDPDCLVQVRYLAADRSQFRPAVKRIQNVFNQDRISHDQAEVIARTLLGILGTETPAQLESTKKELTSSAVNG